MMMRRWQNSWSIHRSKAVEVVESLFGKFNGHIGSIYCAKQAYFNSGDDELMIIENVDTIVMVETVGPAECLRAKREVYVTVRI